MHVLSFFFVLHLYYIELCMWGKKHMATHHKRNLSKALCVMEENPCLCSFSLWKNKNEWDSCLIQLWPRINWDTHAATTSGLQDSLADSAHQGTSDNLTPGPVHLEKGKGFSVLCVVMYCLVFINLKNSFRDTWKYILVFLMAWKINQASHSISQSYFLVPGFERLGRPCRTNEALSQRLIAKTKRHGLAPSPFPARCLTPKPSPLSPK